MFAHSMPEDETHRAGHGKQGRQIEPVKRDPAPIEGWHYLPVPVEKLEYKEPYCHEPEHSKVALTGPRQQDEERDNNVTKQNRRAHPRPGPFKSVSKPDRLFRQVCVPDQQVLRESNVRPEDDHREQPLPEIMIVLHPDGVTENIVVAE